MLWPFVSKRWFYLPAAALASAACSQCHSKLVINEKGNYFTVDAPGSRALKLTVPARLSVGEYVDLVPYVENQAGQSEMAVDAQASVDKSELARVDGLRLSALSPGLISLSVSTGDLKQAWTLMVTAERIAQFGLSSRFDALPIGVSVPIQSFARATNGRFWKNPSVNWSVEDPAIASLENGILTGMAPGQTALRGTYQSGEQGLAIEARVTVIEASVPLNIEIDPPVARVPLGQAALLRAYANFAGGGRFEIVEGLQWSGMGQNGNVSWDEGRGGWSYLPMQASTTDLSASYLGKSGNVLVTALTGKATGLEVGDVPSIPTGGVAYVQVWEKQDDGTRINVSSQVQAASSRAAVAGAVASSEGLRIEGISPGQSELSVSYGGNSLSFNVTIAAPSRFKALEIQAPNAGAAPGVPVSLKAVATLLDGSLLDVSREVTWSLSDLEAAVLSNEQGSQGRLVLGTTGRSVEVGAQYPFGDSAKLVISPASGLALQSIEISGAASVKRGKSIALQAFGNYSDGVRREITSAAQWSSDAPSVASVSNSAANAGTVTGLAANAASTMIAAQFGGLSAQHALAVEAKVVEGLVLRPGSARVGLGIELRFQAIARYSDGSERDAATRTTWSHTGAFLSHLLDGAFQAVAAGNEMVTAQAGEFNAQASVEVTNAGAGPSLVLLSPIGGENWDAGTSKKIEWSTDSSETVEISLSADNGTSYPTILATALAPTSGLTDPAKGEYAWSVSGSAASTYRVRLRSGGLNAESTRSFSIANATPTPTPTSTATPTPTATATPTPTPTAAASITVTSPNGGESYPKYSTQTVTWTSSNLTGQIDILVSVDGGSTYSTLVIGDSDDGIQYLAMPGTAGSATRIKVRSSTNHAIADESDSNLTITEPPSISLTSPNGGESYVKNTNQTVTWTSSALAGNVDILISSDGGVSYPTVLLNGTANDGSQSITMPNIASTTMKLKIQSSSDASISDVGNGSFTLVNPPTITLTSPNGGESYLKNSNQTVTWTSADFTGNVDILASADGGASYSTLVSGTADDGSQSVTMPNASTTTARIKVQASADTSVADASDADFALTVAPSITLISPNGGEIYVRNTPQTVTWTSTGNIGNVDIDYSINGVNYIGNLLTNTPDDGSESVTMPNGVHATVRLKLKSSVDGSVFDVGDGDFTLTDIPTITVTSPNGGENYTKNTNQTVTWTSTDLQGTVDILVSDSGAAFITLVSGTANDGSQSVTMPNAASPNMRIKVQSTNDNAVNDQSDADFTLDP